MLRPDVRLPQRILQLRARLRRALLLLLLLWLRRELLCCCCCWCGTGLAR
jgi:hypothetical protein